MAKKKMKMFSAEKCLGEALISNNEQPYAVPDNWVWTRLGAIVSLKSGTTFPQESERSIGEMLYLKVADMNLEENKFEITTSSRFVNNYVSSQLIPQKSILFPKRGGAIFTNKKRITNNPILADLNIMSITPFIADFLFTYYWFLTIDLSTLNNGSNVPQINNKDIEPLKFPLPPLSEQRRIVKRIESLFERLDRAKELAQTALNNFDTRKAAILHKAFSGELTAKWREENGVRLESWENKYLKDVVEGFRYGTSEKSDYTNNGTPVIRIPNISDGYIDFSDMKYLRSDIIKDVDQLLSGDILIIRSNGSRDLVGKCALVEELAKTYTYASYLIRVRPKQINARYLLALFQSTILKTQLFSRAKSSAGINNINSQELGRLQIPVPSISEQIEIVRLLDFLFEIERQTQEKCNIIDKIDLIKTTILNHAFRGKLGTNDPKEKAL